MVNDIMELMFNWSSKSSYRNITVLAVISIQLLVVFQTAWADCNAPPATGTYSNATSERFADGTTVEFYCGTGYNIIGRPVHRTCLGEDTWTDGPDRYNCEIKVISIAVACVVCVVILIVFAVLVTLAMRRLRKPSKQSNMKDLESNEDNEEADIGQENPYFIENGVTDDELNLDLFEMDGGGGGDPEGTSATDNYQWPPPVSSTLPRMGEALPALPITNGSNRFSTFPKPAASATTNDNSDKDKDHIYDSIKHPPQGLGESQEINSEPFTRV